MQKFQTDKPWNFIAEVDDEQKTLEYERLMGLF